MHARGYGRGVRRLSFTPFLLNSITDPTQSNLQKLAAVGEDEYIYTSANSGVTWTEQTQPGLQNWRSIASSSDGTVRQVRRRQPTPPSLTPHPWVSEVVDVTVIISHSRLRCLMTDPTQSNLQKLAAVNRDGYVYTSADSGATWTEQTGSAQLDWRSIASSSDGTVRQIRRRQPTLLSITPSPCMREVVGVAVVASPSRFPCLMTDPTRSKIQKLAAVANLQNIYTSP